MEDSTFKISLKFNPLFCYLPGPNSVLLCPDWSPTSKALLISGWFYVQNTSPVLAFSLFPLLPPWSKRHHLLPGLGWWLLTGIPGPPLPLQSSLNPQGAPFTPVIVSHSPCSGHTGLLIVPGPYQAYMFPLYLLVHLPGMFCPQWPQGPALGL